MRYALMAGLLATLTTAAPAQAAEQPYWRVETVITMDHPRPVGSGYVVTERRVSVDWSAPGGQRWSAFRELGARPKTAEDEAAWKADGSPTSWTYRTEGMKVTLSTEPDRGWVKQDKTWKGDSFTWGDTKWSYQRLKSLPTDPAKLKAVVTEDVEAWADEAAEESRTTGSAATRAHWTARIDRYVAGRLAVLMHQLPTTREVRAAAFAALKSVKGVRDLGDAKDSLGRAGRRFALPADSNGKGWSLRQEVMVDTRTMTLLSWFNDVEDAKLRKGAKTRLETFAKVGWTNERPAVPAVR